MNEYIVEREKPLWAIANEAGGLKSSVCVWVLAVVLFHLEAAQMQILPSGYVSLHVLLGPLVCPMLLVVVVVALMRCLSPLFASTCRGERKTKGRRGGTCAKVNNNIDYPPTKPTHTHKTQTSFVFLLSFPG